MPSIADGQPYVFISYASADRARVLPLVDRLEAAGVTTWIDREGIHGGANYAQEITEAIKDAAVLVLFCSASALSSRNIRQELALGWRFEKPYLPLLLEPVTVPDEVAYWLEAAQWVEILDRSESDWLGGVAQALARHAIMVRLPNATATAAPIRERPLLVGRDQEQAQLREQLDRMLSGQGGTVLVGGEAGIGKTTLVEDLSVQAEEAGALVVWGHAYDLSVTPPYGPWLELFRQYGRTAVGQPPLPPFIFDAEELAKVGSQETLFTAVADFLRTVAAQRPLVLVLDDLHWFDQASLDFFRFLARQVADQRLLLIATYRSDELTPRHPLSSLMPLFVREAGAERLEVRPLDETGHRGMIQHRYVLPESAEARLVHYLEERAEGNPLYASELLRTLEDEGVLREQDGTWALGNLEQARVPLLLRQVIEGRLSRLGDDTRRLLAMAAVFGPEIPIEIWQAVSRVSDEVLVSAIEQGQDAHLVMGSQDGRVRFSHSLIREALYEGVVVMRRRNWHRTIGEVLTEQGSVDPGSVAYHFENANDPRAIEWWIRAAERAARAYAWRIAAEQLEAAVRSHEQLGTHGIRPQEILLQAAMLLRYADPRTAIDKLNEAIAAAERAGDGAVEAVALAERGYLRHALGEIRAGMADVEEAVTRCDLLEAEDPSTFDRVGLPLDGPNPQFLRNTLAARRGLLVLMWALAGQFGKALVRAERLRETLAAGASVSGAARPSEAIQVAGSGNLCLGLALTYVHLGRVDDAAEFFEYADYYYQAERVPFVVALTAFADLVGRVLIYLADRPGERERAADRARSAWHMAREIGPTDLPQNALEFPVRLLEGDWQAARSIAEACYVSRGFGWYREVAINALATLDRRQGNAEQMLSRIAEVLPDGPATEPGNCRLSGGLEFQRLAADFALEQIDLAKARAWLEAHDRWLDWSGAVLGRADGVLLWAQYHHAEGDPAQARQHAEQSLAFASDPRQPLALIAVHRFLGQLATEEQRFDKAEDHLQQSLTLAEACAAPFERALTLLELAKLRMAQRQLEGTKMLLAEIREICEPLEAKPTLEKVAALEQRLG